MPVLLDLGALFVAFCVFCICWLLLTGYRATLGKLIGKLAELSYDIHLGAFGVNFHPFHWLGDDLEKINHFVETEMGAVVAASWKAWNLIVGQTAQFIHETMDVVAELSEATERGFRHISTTVIHEAVDIPVMGLRKLFGKLAATVVALAATVAALPHAITNTVTHEVTKVVTKIETRTKVIVHTIVHAPAAAIAVTQPRVGSLEREAEALKKWVRANSRKITEAGIVGLVIASLARIGINWTRCSNTKKVGQHVCGMDPSLIETLLADTVMIVGTIDLVEFATELGTVVKYANKEAQRFWRVG